MMRQQVSNSVVAGKSPVRNIPKRNNYSLKGTTAIPPEIRGWNWGAFLLTWIWGIGNRVWVAFIVFIPVPLLALIMAFMLGAKGNEWAWRSKNWHSVDHFRMTQKNWAYWGIALFVLSIIFMAAIYILVFVALMNAIPFDIWTFL